MSKDTVKVRLDVAVNEAEKALRRIEKQTTRNSQAWTSFVGNVGANLATAAISKLGGALMSVGGAIIDFGKSSLDAASNIEDLETRFATLTSNAGDAQDIMTDLTNFAANTPFQLEGLADTSAQLLSFGFRTDELLPKLKDIGDVAAATGTDLGSLGLIFGQVSAAGKLTGERLNQLQERGIPILSALADTMGVAETEVRDLVSSGKVGFAEFETAFSSLSQEGGVAFEGMLTKSKTLSGVYSTLADNWTLKSAEIGKSLLPIAKQLGKLAIQSIQAFDINIIKNWITNGILLAIDGLRAMVDYINPLAKYFQVIWNAWQIVFQGMSTTLQTFWKVAAGRFASGVDLILGIITRLPSSMVPDGWIENLENVQVKLEEASTGITDNISEAAESMKTDFNDIGTAIDTNLIGEEKLEAFRTRLDQAKNAVIKNNKELNKEANKQRKLDDKNDKDDLKGQKTYWQTHFGTAKEWKDATVAYEKLKDQEKRENLKSSLSSISTLTSSNNKDLFFVGKAAAVSQATIDGTAAVQKALASAPPPFNFALATLVGVASAANIAKIASAKPPKYKDGGIVPGASFTGDQVMARVNSGEMILNQRQQANLFNQINSGGGSGNTEGLLIELISAVRESKSIQIDGREIISVVRDEIGRGRTIA